LKDIIEAPNIDGFRALKPEVLVHGAIEGWAPPRLPTT
jgi:hypothetical protein